MASTATTEKAGLLKLNVTLEMNTPVPSLVSTVSAPLEPLMMPLEQIKSGLLSPLISATATQDGLAGTVGEQVRMKLVLCAEALLAATKRQQIAAAMIDNIFMFTGLRLICGLKHR